MDRQRYLLVLDMGLLAVDDQLDLEPINYQARRSPDTRPGDRPPERSPTPLPEEALIMSITATGAPSPDSGTVPVPFRTAASWTDQDPHFSLARTVHLRAG